MLNFNQSSLPEVHGSVNATGRKSWWKFLGPGFLVSVGYMDPGNWATDLAGGSKFGYQLLWVILVSNLMAILLQSICVRIGIAGGFDLAQGCSRTYKRPMAVLLWLLAEIAMIATDIAEVIGSAIALNLLFGIPKVAGVLITGFDVLLILGLMQYGFRKLEAFIAALVATIGVCFFLNLYMAKPDYLLAAKSLVPQSGLGGESLAIAIGIIGATVMPHNLYLHSAVVQTRATDDKRFAVKHSTIDTIIALGGAFFVNAAILILAASVFHARGQVVESIEQAHELLKPLLGGAAATLFALALLASGQSSTITGTLAGQVVMEGFMNWKIAPWKRRMITRCIALIPAILVVLFGEGRDVDGLVLSQIVLSLQLPFAVFPLVILGASRKLLGDLAISLPVKIAGLLVGGVISALNIAYLKEKFGVGIVGGAVVLMGLFFVWVQFIWKEPTASGKTSVE
jgi:manganese transport protein